MSFFDELISPETLQGIRNKIIGYAQPVLTQITNWIAGGVGQQLFEFISNAIYNDTLVVSKVIRGFASLQTSTDPGDDDPYDATNATLPWSPGFLSALGQNSFGTTRNGPTFATGSVTFTNAGGAPVTFAPDQLTFTRDSVDPTTGAAPTYRNAAAPSIYTDPGGTCTVSPGTSVVLPVVAELIGTGSNAAPGHVTLTTVVGAGCSAINTTAILATDLEDAATYRRRCVQAASKLSFGDPTGAYEYFATQNLDGSPLLNASGTPVAITRVWVSQDSSVGAVDVFYASASGKPIDDDVNAARDNTRANMVAIIDAITFTPAAATTLSIAVSGSVEIKNGTGGLFGTQLQSAVQNAIVAALTTSRWAATLPIGGFDQDASGTGTLYKVDLQTQVGMAYPGAYKPALALPAGDTVVPTGNVPVLSTQASDWTVTLK